MAQLSDDCFAFSGPLMPVDEVERLVQERVAPAAETELIPLAQASGRVLAGDSRLAIVDRVTAGHVSARALGRHEAIRVFTGAPMPSGADTVFMQEDCRVEDGRLIAPPGLKAGANRRLAGEDIRAGAVALPGGRRLAPQHVALAAAIGVTELSVRRRVRVALFSTGDEIVEPGAPLPAAALYDANR